MMGNFHRLSQEKEIFLLTGKEESALPLSAVTAHTEITGQIRYAWQ